MKVAFLSKYGDAADIAFRMATEAEHKVKLYIDDPKCSGNWEGIVPKAKTWEEAVKGVDLVVFDDNKLSHVWNKIHKEKPCFGGSPFAARLEEDRGFAHQIMENVGIERIESKTFKTLKEVIPHLKEHNVPHVIKPQGSKVESHHLIIGQDYENSDAIDEIDGLIKSGLQVDKVEVEERKHGVEVGISFFFNGLEPIYPIEINFEHKHSHEKETGYLTGEMGTLMRYVEDKDLPLYKETLAKMIPALRAVDYRGQINLNLIVGKDENGPFHVPLEFTPRLGKPSIFLSDELHVTPWVDLFMACAVGKDVSFQVRYDWCVGIMLCAFGFPFDQQVSKISKGKWIQGLDEHSLSHVHPLQVYLDSSGKFRVGDGNGWFLCATGRGDSIQKAKDMAYSHLAPIKVANSFKRFDIGDKISPWVLDDMDILPIEEAVAA